MGELSEQEAFVGVALVAAYSDGSMGAEENEALAEDLLEFAALRSLDESDLRAAMMKVDAIARKSGDDALLAQAASAIRPELRATAFCLGASLVIADDEYAAEERDFLERLQKALGVEPALAGRIVDVLAIRHRA